MRLNPLFAGFLSSRVNLNSARRLASGDRGDMRKLSIELPKVRLELNYRLVKRRKPLISEPLIPSVKRVKRKYRTGSLVGRMVRYLSEHRLSRKFLAGNLAAVAVASTLYPSVRVNDVQAFSTPPDETIIQAQNTLITEKSLQMPLGEVKVNQGFSFFHPGDDLGAPVGTPVKAIKAGVVLEAGYQYDGYGNTVLIDHGMGLTSRYAHLSIVEVNVGENVTTNTEIGKVGLTGHTTGPHLHLEIRQNGIPLNPLTVLPR